MAAEYTLTSSRFPDGTIVHANPLNPPRAEPVSAVVSGGSAVFEGLRELEDYLAHATVAGVYTEARFTTDGGSSVSGEGGATQVYVQDEEPAQGEDAWVWYRPSTGKVTFYAPEVAAPSFTVDPVISGTALVGSTLTCDGGTVSGNPTPTKTYQWKNAGSNISGETASTYVLQASDVGDAITCTVVATNDEGSDTATSNTITHAIPANSVAPAVTGSAVTGQTLTCSTGTWSGSPTYAYQWKRAGSSIGGATSSTYVLQVDDEGVAVKCTVTATNANGSASADSNSLTPSASPTAPGVPLNLMATPGSGQVALDWDPPASDGGASITDYVVQYRTPAGSGSYTTFSDGTSTTSAATVTGLTNGSGYGFRVAAVNSVGTGSYTSEVTATPAGAATYADEVLADSPVAYWKLNESSGTSMADSAGSHTGTYSGSPTFSATEAISDGGSAVTFDGVDDAASVPNHADFRFGTGDFSFEFWIKTTEASLVVILGKLGGSDNYYLATSSGSPVMNVNGTAHGIGPAINDGNWHHVVWTRVGTTATVYVDAVARDPGTISGDAVDPTGALAIANYNGGNYFPGTLDEIAIYRSALSPTRITAHYDAR